jgi:hypothetical protein
VPTRAQQLIESHLHPLNESKVMDRVSKHMAHMGFTQHESHAPHPGGRMFHFVKGGFHKVGTSGAGHMGLHHITVTPGMSTPWSHVLQRHRNNAVQIKSGESEESLMNHVNKYF